VRNFGRDGLDSEAESELMLEAEAMSRAVPRLAPRRLPGSPAARRGPLSAPRVLTYPEVRSEQIDVDAQRSLLRMSRNPQASADAAGMADEVRARSLAGIYKEDQRVPALRAQRMNRGWWQIIPASEDAVLFLDPASPLREPLISFRNNIGSVPARLDAALRKAWQTYVLLRTNRLRPCAPATSTDTISSRPSLLAPVSNLQPPILCTISRLDPPEAPPRRVCCQRIEMVSIWVNAFIRNDPDLMQTVPGGPHRGKMMIVDTDVNCLLTDQRDFDPNPAAPSRFQSRIDIAVPEGIFIQSHRSDRAFSVACRDGAVFCGADGSTSQMQFMNFKRTANSSFVRLTTDLRSQYRHPCSVTPFVPIISGRFVITYESTLMDRVFVSFSGKRRAFPAFEIYVSLNGGVVVPMSRSFFPGRTLQDPPQSFVLKKSLDLQCSPALCNVST
jgi:hypothetical protein